MGYGAAWAVGNEAPLARRIKVPLSRDGQAIRNGAHGRGRNSTVGGDMRTREAEVTEGNAGGLKHRKFEDRDGELSVQNRTRWNALSKAGVLYAKPFLGLNRTEAHRFLDTEGLMDPPEGKRVLVLAGGGGQQSACLALLGAQVTVLDLSDEQLERDRGSSTSTWLSTGPAPRRHAGSVTVRWQLFRHGPITPHSINFVPDVGEVFAEVARGVGARGPIPGGLAQPVYPSWSMTRGTGKRWATGCSIPIGMAKWTCKPCLAPTSGLWNWRTVRPCRWIHPRSWVHTLGTFVGGLARNGFVILGIGEETSTDDDAEPGSWGAFQADHGSLPAGMDAPCAGGIRFRTAITACHRMAASHGFACPTIPWRMEAGPSLAGLGSFLTPSCMVNVPCPPTFPRTAGLRGRIGASAHAGGVRHGCGLQVRSGPRRCPAGTRRCCIPTPTRT